MSLNLVQRICLSFFIIIFIMSIATWTANEALKNSEQALSKATNIESTKIRDVGRMVQNLIALQRSEKNLILSKTPAEMDEYSQAIRVEDQTLRGLLVTSKTLVSNDGAALLNDFALQYDDFRMTQDEVVALSRDNANVKARALSQGAGREIYDIAINALQNVITINDLHADKANQAVLTSGSIIRLSARTVQDLLSITRAERNMILSQTQTEMDEYASFIELTRSQMKDRRAQLRELVDEGGKIFLDDFSVVWEEFLAVDRQVRDLTRENGNNKARSLSQGDARISFDNTLKALHGLQDRVALQTLAFEKLMLAIENHLLTLQRAEKNLILARSTEEMNEYLATVKVAQTNLADFISQLSGSISDPQLFSPFQTTYREYVAFHKEVVRLSLLNSNVKAFSLASNQGRVLADQSEALLARLTDKNDREHEQLLATLIRISDKSKLSAQVNRLLADMQRAEKNIILATNQTDMNTYSASLLAVRKNLGFELEKMSQLFSEQDIGYPNTSVMQQLSELILSEFNTAYQKYQVINEQVRSVSRRNSNVQALALSTGVGRTQF